ncbi:MAG: hypothetical protein ACXABG_16765 [Promethearchaeota archaeon]|jgi:hypothetical protein
MEIINYLGEYLSKSINISSPAARGLIKLAIKEELDPFKPLNQINYKDFKLVIENSLKQRLIKLEINETSVIIEILLDKLSRFQSLISMSNI